MALGQAAGTAAAISLEENVPVRKANILKLQRRLIQQGAVLIYFKDARPGDPHFEALQFLGLRGFYGQQTEAKLAEPIPAELARKWLRWAKVKQMSGYQPGKTTHGQLLQLLYAVFAE